MFTPQQGHVDTALTNVSVMYRNQSFVSEEVFPPLPVEKQSNKYYVYGLDNLRADDDQRRPGALANEMQWNLSTNSYFADGHALGAWIPDESRENADAALDLDTDTTIQLTDKLMLAREVNTVNAVVAGVGATIDNSAGGTSYWDDDTKDPIKLIDVQKETILQATGQRPNSMIISRPVFRGLRNNALVKGRVSGALNGVDKSLITSQQLAALLEVDNLFVADAIKLTNKEGQANTGAFVWSKYALLFYRPPSPGLRTISLGYEFRWNVGRLGSLVFRSRSDRRHADWIEAMRYYAPTVVAAGAGVLWSNSTQN